MKPNNPLGARSKAGVAALVLVSPLLFTACTETPAESSASPSAATATAAQESPEKAAQIKEVQSVYESFDPARLTELTKKRNDESSDPEIIFVTQGLIEPDSELSIPKISGENKKSLLVSYMCRASDEKGDLWRVDFSADSEPLKSGIQSDSCTKNSVEMFTTRVLSPTELPDALEVTGKVELAVSIFEIEETK